MLHRIKENVTNLSNECIVDNLIPVHYYTKITKQTEIGLIAHEVQMEYTELVTGKKDCDGGYQSVNYIGLVPILIKELQDIKTHLKNQKDITDELYEILINDNYENNI
jgi:hypothetical protein